MNKYASLTPNVQAILVDKNTEAPFSGEYLSATISGSYLCRGCGLALFRADNQFTSHCGWPSFDDELPNTVKRVPDADGRRTEIVCARCDGHLGHVFGGEGYTDKNLRHCVNSLAIEFVPSTTVLDTEEAIVAAGCFWGVEALFKKLPGVLKTEVGYCGSAIANPTYKTVCEGNTGHLEAMRVVYDTAQLCYEQVLKYFFEIHDFEQIDGQGPDLGEQYLSAIFYFNAEQQAIARAVIKQLAALGYTVATQILPVDKFWPAEEYHQDYYTKTGKQPYCHRHIPHNW
jgi:peptide methionine sulfoxide reductase msrA/msrB